MRSLRVLHTTLIFLLLPALALASGGGEEGASLKAQGYYLINFVVFVGILWFLLKDRLGQAWAARRATIKEELDLAARALEEARQREAEARQKQELIPSELAALETRQAEELAALEARSASRLEGEQRRLTAQLEGNKSFEHRQQERRLRQQLALRTLDQLEDLLKTGAVAMDQGALNQGFLKDLGQVTPAAVGSRTGKDGRP
jgi:F-type H+-transporting ATPase subunit b